MPRSIMISMAGGLFLALSLAGCGGSAGERDNQGQTDRVVINNGNGSIMVTAGARDLNAAPVAVEWDGEIPRCMESNGVVTPVQEEQLEDGRSLLWILADASAGESREYVTSQQTDCTLSAFQWESISSDRSLLRIDGLPSIEYIHPVYDSDQVEETMKPFHHVYAPDGSRLITKGVGGNHSHHRGIFHGYRNIQFQDKTVSTWGGSTGHQEHARLIQQWAGPVFGGHEVAIEWKDEDGEAFADEVRKVRAYRRSSGEMLIDLESVLVSRDGPVKLGGDHHHAGLQFRAAQHVYDNPEPSRFLRPDAWADYSVYEEMDDTERYVDVPWNAFQFVVDDEPYTVGYFSHPRNPSGGEMSERLYGRFGEFVPDIVIDEETPCACVTVFWLQVDTRSIVKRWRQSMRPTVRP